jgi:hypothetical protein
LREGTVTNEVLIIPKQKKEGIQDRRKPAVLRTNLEFQRGLKEGTV